MYSSFFGFEAGRLSISIMMARTENGRYTKRMSVVSSTRSMRITVRNVYMLPMENQKSIGSDCGMSFLVGACDRDVVFVMAGHSPSKDGRERPCPGHPRLIFVTGEGERSAARRSALPESAFRQPV